MKTHTVIGVAVAAAAIGLTTPAVATDDTKKLNNDVTRLSLDQSQTAPVSAVGKYIIGPDGKIHGQVIGVLNNKLFVSTDQRLGIGAHPVVVDYYLFKEVEHDGKPALRASMSEADWRNNPVYRIPEGESKMDNDRSVGPREPKTGSTRGFVPPPN